MTTTDIRERHRQIEMLRRAREEAARLLHQAAPLLREHAEGPAPTPAPLVAFPADLLGRLLAASEPLADGACARCLHGIGDHPFLSEWESACTACRCPAWVSAAHVVHLTDCDGECLPGCPTCLGIAWRAVEYAPPADTDRLVLDQLVRDIEMAIEDAVALDQAGAASAAARRVLLNHAQHFVELAPAAADDTSCAMCGEDGEPNDPLRWCLAANGERLVAHRSCWAAPDVPPPLAAHLEAALSALREAGGEPSSQVQAVIDAADKVVGTVLGS